MAAAAGGGGGVSEGTHEPESHNKLMTPLKINLGPRN